MRLSYPVQYGVPWGLSDFRLFDADSYDWRVTTRTRTPHWTVRARGHA